jgi:hypothetical protein
VNTWIQKRRPLFTSRGLLIRCRSTIKCRTASLSAKILLSSDFTNSLYTRDSAGCSQAVLTEEIAYSFSLDGLDAKKARQRETRLGHEESTIIGRASQRGTCRANIYLTTATARERWTACARCSTIQQLLLPGFLDHALCRTHARARPYAALMRESRQASSGDLYRLRERGFKDDGGIKKICSSFSSWNLLPVL